MGKLGQLIAGKTEKIKGEATQYNVFPTTQPNASVK